MYDYMKALQKRFDRQEHSELDKQVKYAREELRRDMAKELEADGLYSFEKEEEEHICHPAEQED